MVNQTNSSPRPYGKSSSKGRSSKKWFLILAVIVLILGVAYTVNTQHNAAKAANQKPVITGKIPSGKTNGTHSIGSSQSTNSGTAIDKKGQATATTQPTDSSAWATDESGNITLKQPVKNATLSNGATIRGSSKLDTIQYRLVDDSSGVIAEGALSVTNGDFSGVLQFQPKGTTGTLKIFSFDQTSGAEVNRIEIPIKLQK